MKQLVSLDWLEKNQSLPDYIVHIRPTTPLRIPKYIDQAISLFKSKQTKASSLRSVQIMSESAYKSFEIDNNGKLEPIFSSK